MKLFIRCRVTSGRDFRVGLGLKFV